MSGTGDKVAGSVKQKVGHATGNHSMEAEGAAQRAKGHVEAEVGRHPHHHHHQNGGTKDQIAGGAKEVVGKVTGNRAKEHEGKVQKEIGKAKKL